MKYFFLYTLFFFSCQAILAQGSEDEDLSSSYEEGTDTVPLIYITDTSLVFPRMFEGSFLPNTWVKQWDMNIQFFTEEVGNLKITSGKIIAGDPALLFNAEPFKYEFPKGEFPVEVAIARLPQIDRIGFARVRFSNAKVHEWQFAIEADEKDTLIVGEDYYGYSTNAGLWTFIDTSAAHYLNEMNVYKYWKNVILGNIGDEQAKHIIQLPFPYEYANLAVVESGMGDGFYSPYVGLDKDGNICQLLVDFEIINWWYNP